MPNEICQSTVNSLLAHINSNALRRVAKARCPALLMGSREYKLLLSWVLMVLLTLMLPLQSAAQGWLWATPYPTGDYCRSVSFMDSLRGWLAAGSSGFIFHTVDGGRTWEYQDLGSKANINAVMFVDDQFGWAAGNDSAGVIYLTTNGGQAWERATIPNGELPLTSLQFVGRDIGFAACQSNMILKTTDGGGTWTERRVNHNYLGAMFLLDSRIGFVIGDHFYVTHDGGDTWIQQGSQSGAMCGLYFRDSTAGWLADPHTGLLATSDGGRSWVTKVADVSLTSVTFIGQGHGIAWGSAGQYSSVDSGQTWTLTIDSLEFGNGQMLSSTLGFNAAGFGKLYRTTDGGVSWMNVCSKVSSASISSVWMKTSDEIWAVGGSNVVGGEVLVSSNGGSSWEKKVSRYPKWLRDITFTTPNEGWVVGDQGALLKSTDGGDTWSPVAQTTAGLKTILFLDQIHGWCGGAGVILATIDGGTLWTSTDIANGDDVNAIFLKNTSEGWACGGSVNEGRGVIFHTSDGGLSWQTQFSGLVNPLLGIAFTDSVNGWSVGDVVLRTSDGGQNWVSTPTQEWPYTGLTSVRFLGQEGWVAGFSGLITHTTDGGMTWTRQRTPTDGPILKITLDESGLGFAAVGGNGILKTTSAGVVTSVASTAKGAPGQVALSQNFPNPFNPTTTICYCLPRRSHVLLAIFNPLGQRVAQLVDDDMDVGFHQVQFNGGHLASGIYFYRLTVGPFVETKRLVVVK